MLVKSLKDFNFRGKIYRKGDVFEIPSEMLTTLKGIFEPLSEEEALEHFVKTSPPSFYIREFRYLDKTLKDVLIISKEQLRRCLKDPEYGEVFRAYIRSMT